MIEGLGRALCPPAPAERLAGLRILVAGYLAVYLVARGPAILRVIDRPTSQFESVGVLSWLHRPLADPVVVGWFVATVGLAVLVALGWRHRIIGPAFAVAVLLLFTYRSCWGQILWFEILPVLHAVVIGFAGAAADAWSLDARRTTAAGLGPDDVPPTPLSTYGWPVRLAALMTVTTYGLAGLAKLRIGGWAWIANGSLADHVGYSARRLEVFGHEPSPLAAPVEDVRRGFAPFGAVVVALELLAPIAVFFARFRTGWVLAIWLMHVVIAATMFVVFPYPLIGVALAPLFPIERIASISWRRPARLSH